jgi:3D (Asp-Asp-Asp) domain-containing protein
MIKSPASAIGGAIKYQLKTNAFGDTLPIIPSDSKVLFGSVLFRVDIEITVTRAGAAVFGTAPTFRVTGVHSHARVLRTTDHQGKTTLRLETRITGKNTITPLGNEFSSSTFDVEIGEAWYESRFLITAYNCCDEDDFSGALVETDNVGKRKKDFLFGGKGICMQGTGLGSDGKYIKVTNPKELQWNPGYAGVANPDDAEFTYTDGVYGAYSEVTENSSIAIDPHILPPRHRVNIVGPRTLGERSGDDTGGAIKDHHFDNYVGAGDDAMDKWNTDGGNIQHAKVKYLGE